MRSVAVVVLLLCAAARAQEPVDALGDPLPDGAVRRLGTARLRCTDTAQGVLYTPDGKRILSCGDARGVRMWDAATGGLLGALRHPDGVEFGDIAVPSEGAFVVAGTNRPFDANQLCVWELSTGKLVATFAANEERIEAVACTADGRLVASAGRDRVVLVFERATGKRVAALRAPAQVDDIDFSPDGRMLAVAAGPKAETWEVASGRRRTTLSLDEPGADDTRGLAYSPDGRHIAVCWHCGSVAVFDAGTGKLVHHLKGHTTRVDAVAWSPDGRRLASADYGREIRVWDTATGEPLAVKKGSGEWFLAVAFSPDGRSLAVASHTILVLDAETLEERLARPGHRDAVHALAIASDGCRMASGAGVDPILVWDLRTGELKGQLPHDGFNVTSLDFAPGTSYLAAGLCHQTLAVWDVADPKPLFVREGAEDQWQYVRCSPDGKQVAWSSGPMIRILALPSGEQNGLFHHKSELTNDWHNGKLVYAEDGKLLAFLDDGTLRAWDAGKQSVLFRWPEHAYSSPALSPDAKLIALDGGEAGFRDLDAPDRARPLADPEPKCQWGWLGVSPSGAHALSWDAEGVLLLWETATGRICATLRGHDGWCFAARFTPDGRFVATAGADTTILLWDLADSPGAPPAPAKSAAEARKLAGKLRGEDAAQAFLAVGGLARSGDVALPALREDALGTKQPVACARALTALELMGTPGAVDILRSVSKRHSNAKVKGVAAAMVARREKLKP